MLSLFSGVGGIDLAAQWVGFEIAAFVEWEPFCQEVLRKRFPGVPVYGDVREVTAERLRNDGVGKIDMVVGGFPCQPFSVAGKRAGQSDERHLWPEMVRIIRELEPQWVLGENVPGLLSIADVCGRKGGAFGGILRDLAESGYRVGWHCISAAEVGAPHKRERVFIMGNAEHNGWTAAEVTGGIEKTVRNYQKRQNETFQSPGTSFPRELSGELRIMWPTPRANDSKNSTLPPSNKSRDSIPGAFIRSGEKGQLNPSWVEILMGFPVGWTDPDCDEPELWQGWPAGMGVEQYQYEPPRVSTGVKDRAKRLKALGNAVVPAQIYPIFAAIAQIEGVE